MSSNIRNMGLEQLRTALRDDRSLLWIVGLFSAFVNLLMLTGPLFMLQVYDRVLGSRSEETLVALFVLIAFLFGMMGILDFSRGRILSRIAARFQEKLDQRVFTAVMRARATRKAEKEASTGMADLEGIRSLIASPVLAAFFDIPWTPIFLFGIFLFHPWMGYLAIGGGGILIAIALLNQFVTRQAVLRASQSQFEAQTISGRFREDAELIQSLGMLGNTLRRWEIARSEALEKQVVAGDSSGIFSVTTKTLRMFLQSTMLALGAYLVLQQEVTAGAMIAGSILMGRALAPVELVIGQWANVQRAIKGRENLAVLLGTIPEQARRLPLPQPKAHLLVDQATIIPPGETQAALRMVSFNVAPGSAVGVIGASGAGKSTLARALTGGWPVAGGAIRLDGASLDQYDPDDLGRHIGYLPQQVTLFTGTIAENIAHLEMEPNPEQVVAAAKKADAHEMIVNLPKGYDTLVSDATGRLSGGQVQRIGLARALFGNPVILVLDEPNSNLDNDGSIALNTAIKAMRAEGKTTLIMAHRPAAIKECDQLLMLENGMVKAFGPKEEVLQKFVSNHQQVLSNPKMGGVS
ncbi:type I secretion system permease/ATPase [Cochlodiniinecator piscidefendens]|uniref:type I secretion system permease/ATPase n=1 Tax=Cochlodiniinecator piscidefendens TaxID=2715756 RepID=UPI00140DD06D|nr:type I secretion system permease/ATPase [Cochlodiniinecator piscidefendens]